MPAFNFGTIEVYRGRQSRYKITMYDADGDGVALEATDNVRVKITAKGSTATLLDVDDDATANGSKTEITQTTAPAEVTLTLASADLAALTARRYDLEISVVDDSQTGDPIESAGRGVLSLKDSPDGAVTLA